VVVDFDVDTNRNGTVEDSPDETGESAWSTALGAVFYLNVDDDDNNNNPPVTGEDHLDATVNGPADGNDLAPLVIRQMATLPSTATLTVTVSTTAQSRVRVFRNDGGGSWSQAYAAGASFLVPASLAIAGEVLLGIEARERVSPLWDGRVTLTLEARDQFGALLGSDAVLLRSAPWIMCSNLWTLEDLCVVNMGTNNLPFRNTLSSVCSTAGVTYVVATGSTYNFDRWIQDSHETGAIYLPATPRRRVDQVLQCARWREVDDWCEDVPFGPDFDFIRRFSSNTSSHNYGGNLEVTGPLSGYPWGRILIGGGTSAPIGGGSTITDRMVQAYRDYFTACDLQAPWLEVSTEWLWVGHVDEIVQIVPAPATSRGWAVLIASPDLARANLQTVADSGGGSLTVFAGRGSGWQTTVSAILADSALMTYNAGAQARIDGVQAVMQTQLGLSASDFIEVPVLFENAGSNFALAYNPGVVNLIVMPSTNGTTYLVIPDPEGPDQPTDVWQATTTTALQALFTAGSPVSITYADVWSYHVAAGEAHCGVNFVRTPPDADWWDD
jgi:protein-arginine deiminase